MINKKYIQVTILTLASSLMFGCSTLKSALAPKIHKPEIEYIDYKIGGSTTKNILVYLHFKAHNPNKIGLKNTITNYEVFIGENRLIQGETVKFDLKADGDTPIVVPAEIFFNDSFKTLSKISSDILQGKRSIPIQVKVTIAGTPTLYNDYNNGELFSYTFTTNKTIDVPIPEGSIETITDKTIEELDKLKRFF